MRVVQNDTVRGKDGHGSELAPVSVGRLFLDKFHVVELGIELVRLGPRITDESLLVQAFGNLYNLEFRWEDAWDGRERTSRIFLGLSLSNLEPDFCNSTVVNGSGFLLSSIDLNDTFSRWAKGVPFGRRLGLDLYDLCLPFHTRLVQRHGRQLVKQPAALPGEFDGGVVPVECDGDVVEGFGDERLDSVVLVDDKAQCRELTWTCIPFWFGPMSATTVVKMQVEARKDGP